MAEKRKIPKPLKLFNKIKNILFGVLIAVLCLIIISTLVVKLTGNAPNLFGFTLYRVSSESMYPTLEVGDIILVRSCDPLTLKNGDIVTFEGTVGDQKGKSITHRVVVEPYCVGAETYIVTRGDANTNEDSPTNVDKVIGKMLIKVDILRDLYNFFITPWGLITLIALIILAFFNEIVIFVRTLMGYGYEDEDEEETVEQLIERYRQEDKKSEEADPDSSDGEQNDETEQGEPHSPDESSDSDNTDDYIF